MCHKPTVKSDASEGDVVMPFMRAPGRPGAPPPPRPSRLSFAGVLDDLSEVRAMVGLTSLAAETLPAGHRREFGAILEVVHARLDGIIEVLQHGAGQPPLEPVEA